MYYSPVRHVINIRLACVKYTASVHPEPGSNSLHFIILKKINYINIKKVYNRFTDYIRNKF
jgi:hypothetical protein